MPVVAKMPTWLARLRPAMPTSKSTSASPLRRVPNGRSPMRAPRKRSSSGAARNAPSRTFFPNSRPVLTEPPPLATATPSEALHEVVPVGEGAVAHLGGHAGPVEEILELEPGVLAQPTGARGE